MDWASAKRLVEIDLASLAAKAANPKLTLAALLRKTNDALGEVEGFVLAVEHRGESLPVKIATDERVVERCLGIIDKAEAAGRDDLASAARERMHKHIASRDGLKALLASSDSDHARGAEMVAALEARIAELEAQITGLDPPDGATGRTTRAVDHPTIQSSDHPTDRIGASTTTIGASTTTIGTSATTIGASTPPGPESISPEPSPSAAVASPTAASPTTTPAPSASNGDAPHEGPPKPAGDAAGAGALDDEFAALMAAMDLSDDASAAPSRPNDESDDGEEDMASIMAGLDLVEVGDDELPDGADPDDDAPIDFSFLEKVAANQAVGKTAPVGVAKAAKGAERGKKVPAKAKSGAPGSADGSGKKSKAWLWWTVGVIVAGGGTVAGLILGGILVL